MQIKFKRRTEIELISDICFILYLSTEILLRHSTSAQFALLLLVGSSVLLSLSKKKINYSYYVTIMFIFILYNILNVYTGVSINPQTSLTMINTLLINLIAMWALYNYIVLRNNPKQTLKMFISAYIIVTIIVLLLSRPVIFTERLGQSLGINANLLSILAASSFIITLFFLKTEKKSINYIWLFWFLNIVLLTGSRKGLLIILFGSALLTFLLEPSRKTKNLFLATIFLTTIYLSIMYVPFFYEMIGNRFEALINYRRVGDTEEASLRTRSLLIERGWGYILSQPLRGYGLDSFKSLPQTHGLYSHNNFIEILVSGGVIGLLLYYLNHLIAFIGSFRYRDNGDGVLKLMLTLNAILLINEYALVSYYGRPYLNLLIMMIGFTKVYANNKKTEISSKERCG